MHSPSSRQSRRIFDPTRVSIDTSCGRLVAEIYVDKAPITARNFLRHVDDGLYRNAAFYRALRPDNGTRLPNLRIVQGGINPVGSPSPFPPIPHESTETTDLSHVNGALSMARWEPGTATSEFFVVIGDGQEFDFGGLYGEGFAVFGRVTEGMDVVQRINESPTGKSAAIDYLIDEALKEPVTMRIERVPRSL